MNREAGYDLLPGTYLVLVLVAQSRQTDFPFWALSIHAIIFKKRLWIGCHIRFFS